MEGQYTVKDAVQAIMNLLGGISVPRVLNQQIGVPIDRAIWQLQQIMNTFNKAEEEEAKRKEAEKKAEEEKDADADAE